MTEISFLKVFRPQIGIEDAIEREEVPARLRVGIKANIILSGVGNIPHGQMSLSFDIPHASAELPLSSLERSADAAAADVLEAIAVELRKRAAG